MQENHLKCRWVKTWPSWKYHIKDLMCKWTNIIQRKLALGSQRGGKLCCAYIQRTGEWWNCKLVETLLPCKLWEGALEMRQCCSHWAVVTPTWWRCAYELCSLALLLSLTLSLPARFPLAAMLITLVILLSPFRGEICGVLTKKPTLKYWNRSLNIYFLQLLVKTEGNWEKTCQKRA